MKCVAPTPLVVVSLVLTLGWTELTATTSYARTWTDSSGKYSIEAELFAYDDKQVILERESDKELGSVPIDHLSTPDRKYLESKEAEARMVANTNNPQVWTTRTGLKIVGRLVDYASKEITIRRRRGKILVNDRAFDNLPDIYQRIVPQIVGHYDQNNVSDKKSLEAWLVHREGGPLHYQVEGIILELKGGDEYGIPFFLLSEEDRQVLQPGWQRWLAAADDHQQQKSHAFRLEATAAAHQQDREARRQIAEARLNLQAIDAGISSLWEVTLYPGRGNHGSPLWVTAMGRNSAEATRTALANHPGYTAGPVRRVSR